MKTLLTIVALTLLAACGTREVLQARSADVPHGVNFSGNWQIRPEMANDQRRLQEAIRRTDGVDDRDVFRSQIPAGKQQRRRSGGRRGVKGGLVDVFLETGRNLKVTQTADGIFISFDRAVVEEYRFGEQREINVGEVTAQRVSGWEGEQYVVETLDKNGMKLTERYRLMDGGRVLLREITFRSRSLEEHTILQEYVRVES